jgi:NAD-dependent SIR2 family protein deacetylase
MSSQLLAGQSPAEVCFEAVRNRPRDVALLIGAGCSASASIPTANRIVTEICSRFPARCNGLSVSTENSYAKAIELLTEDEWRDLFESPANRARINLTHLCIAELMRADVVDRVLTTNFDPLLRRACDLCGTYPAVFDCSAMVELERVFRDPQPAVYYLHGQVYGVRMLNPGRRLQDAAKLVRQAVLANIERRTLIVCGYSGQCDNIAEELWKAELRNPVFWVPHSQEDAEKAIAQLKDRRNPGMEGKIFVTERADSDRFFCKMLLMLRMDLPGLVLNADGFARDLQHRYSRPSWFDAWFPRNDSSNLELLDGEPVQGPAGDVPPSAPPSAWKEE